MTSWKEFIERYERDSSRSPFEKLFLRNVLSRARGLSPESVRPEHPFHDVDGKNRRIDFAIMEGRYVRLAIEVDGYDKRNAGTGMSREEFVDWSKRELSLVAGGFDVLRFANAYVRDHSERCVQIVDTVLKRARSVAAELEAATNAQRTLSPKEQQAIAAASLTENEKRLLAESSEVNDSRFADLTAKLTAATEQAARLRGEVDRHERRWGSVGRIVVAMAAVFIAALVAIVVVVTRGSNEDGPGTTPATGCTGSIPWTDSHAHVGESVTVEGPVVSTFHDDSGVTFLNVGFPNPNPDRFVVVIFAQARSRFPSPPEVAYRGKTICAVGKVTTFRNVTQIVANDPTDLVVP